MSIDAPVRLAPAWRRAAGSGSTTPERLRRVVAVLAIGCLASALVSVLGGAARTSAVQEAQNRISALTADSAELYRSLADADAMATSAEQRPAPSAPAPSPSAPSRSIPRNGSS
jgi:Tfp pilus assembly protein PilN